MVIKIDADENRIMVLGGGNRKTVKFETPNSLKKCPMVLKVESLTMEEYVPIINNKAIIPDCFDMCDNIDLSIVINNNGKFYESNKV